MRIKHVSLIILSIAFISGFVNAVEPTPPIINSDLDIIIDLHKTAMQDAPNQLACQILANSLSKIIKARSGSSQVTTKMEGDNKLSIVLQKNNKYWTYEDGKLKPLAN